ncbi:hypothetical protein, partial [Streptomyces sp. NPDC059900]|uniref:hypothetical protein n=1 Tax=Streptomyces sp. NPDC059900 TaxID=3155816 RepID=UPI003CFD9461
MSDTHDVSDALLAIHSSALAGMGSSPRHFTRWAALAADEDHPDADLTEETFRSRRRAGAAGPRGVGGGRQKPQGVGPAGA